MGLAAFLAIEALGMTIEETESRPPANVILKEAARGVVCHEDGGGAAPLRVADLKRGAWGHHQGLFKW